VVVCGLEMNLSGVGEVRRELRMRMERDVYDKCSNQIKCLPVC